MWKMGVWSGHWGALIHLFNLVHLLYMVQSTDGPSWIPPSKLWLFTWNKVAKRRSSWPLGKVRKSSSSSAIPLVDPQLSILFRSMDHLWYFPSLIVFQVSSEGVIHSLCAETVESKLQWCKSLAAHTDGIFSTRGPGSFACCMLLFVLLMYFTKVVEFSGYLWKTNPKGTRWDKRWWLACTLILLF